MKKIYLIHSLLFICLFEMSCHAHDKVIITDVNFLNRTSLIGNAFPDCFKSNCDLVTGIYKEVEQLSKQRFGVQEVIFINPDIQNKNGVFRDRLQLDQSSKEGTENELYTAIEFIMDNSAGSENYLNFRITSIITVLDFQGLVVFENKTVQPFEIKEPDDITAQRLISDQDFGKLLEVSINDVFKESDKNRETMSFIRPGSDYWQTSLKGTDKFYLVKKKKEYLFNSSLSGTNVGLKIKRNFWKSLDGGFKLGIVFNRTKIRNNYTLSDTYNNKIYMEKVISKGDMVLESLTYRGEVIVELQEGKNIIGKFTLTSNDLLEGNIYKTDYKVQFDPEFNLTEISCNDAIFAIVKDMHNYMVVYINPDKSELIGYLLDLICINDHSHTALQEMQVSQTISQE